MQRQSYFVTSAMLHACGWQARDRFLKPGGKMFPTQSNIYLAPFCDEMLYAEQ